MVTPDPTRRRLVVWSGVTAAGTVVVFAYPTSTSGIAAARSLPVAPVGIIAAGPANSPAGVVAPPARANGPGAPAPRRSSAPGARAPGSAPVVKPAPAPVPHPAATRTAGSSYRSPAPRSKPAPQPTTETVNGAPADTQYGPVQVQIQVRGRRIVSANAIVYPQDTNRDREINSQAIPQLNQETVQAQSANIDTVSGATYTSDGYRQSLQSALDAAGI